jgi:hypothetical protein
MGVHQHCFARLDQMVLLSENATKMRQNPVNRGQRLYLSNRVCNVYNFHHTSLPAQQQQQKEINL